MLNADEKFEVRRAVLAEFDRVLNDESADAITIKFEDEIDSKGYVDYISSNGNYAARKYFTFAKGVSEYNVMFLKK
ncbi:hypothetical protein [Serratia plymuthica]|uniref:hypothetical protein n=1 Tax=Serratia plymuthica TaxID=82996 RepID=UPI001419E4A2|nr:hypothetical protein [Serratia plymuthica]NIC29336.1 hypothetical protein [Serratia plymuthica]